MNVEKYYRAPLCWRYKVTMQPVRLSLRPRSLVWIISYPPYFDERESMAKGFEDYFRKLLPICLILCRLNKKCLYVRTNEIDLKVLNYLEISKVICGQ